jgi:hypothetical protein
MPEPLAITARLQGAVALPYGPLALDSLLAAAVARRDGIPPALSPAEVQPIEIPVEREPGGRFHLASFSVSETECIERRWVNRRFPLAEAQAMGDAKLRRILISAGPCKSYRLPLETRHMVDDELRWWCIGEREEIEPLLAITSYIGKKRGVGRGRVVRWTVEPCELWDGFPVVRDGKPLRPLPPDWPGLDDPAMAYRTLTYPYWIHAEEKLCAVPD